MFHYEISGCQKGPSIKYVTLVLANFKPPPLVTLCHTYRDPQKYVTHLGPPILLVDLVQKTRTKAPCTNSFSMVRGGFCKGVCQRVFCLESFVRGGFCPFPLLSEYICLTKKVEHHFNFMFHMYDKKFISVTSRALDPLPCHKLSPLLGLPLPSSVTYI